MLERVRAARRDAAVVMIELIPSLDAFLQEHRRCGKLEAEVNAGSVWMGCECGAVIRRQVEEDRARSKI